MEDGASPSSSMPGGLAHMPHALSSSSKSANDRDGRADDCFNSRLNDIKLGRPPRASVQASVPVGQGCLTIHSVHGLLIRYFRLSMLSTRLVGTKCQDCPVHRLGPNLRWSELPGIPDQTMATRHRFARGRRDAVGNEAQFHVGEPRPCGLRRTAQSLRRPDR